MATEVEYRAIPGFADYVVGSDGSVWSSKRSVKGSWRRIGGKATVRGYPVVTLYVRGKGPVMKMVHHLVLLAFVGERPAGMEACHYDDDKRNNAISNLRYGSRQDNVNDAMRNWELRTGKRTYNQKLNDDQVALIRAAAVRGDNLSALARELNVHVATVHLVATGKIWKKRHL